MYAISVQRVNWLYMYSHPDIPITDVFLKTYTKKLSFTFFEMNHIIYKMK